MAISQFLLLFLFPSLASSLFALSEASPISENKHLEDFQGIKLKVALLESKLEEVTRNLDLKGLYIEEKEKLIQNMSQEIILLQSSVSDLKIDPTRANERLNALEKEVQQLWANSRKNNFDIHVLESNSRDTEERLEMVSSQAQKMADIVTEQWIEIQRLEQALHSAQLRTLRAKKIVYSRCSLLRFINNLYDDYLQPTLDFLNPYIHQFKKAFGWTKQYHHQGRISLSRQVSLSYIVILQHFIKLEMEKNEFTAALANGELIFFMASALITLPIISAWMLLS